MSVIVTILNSIAAKLSGLEFGGVALSADIDFAPDLDIAKVKARKVIVSPQSYSRINSTRNDSASSAKINVCVVERIELAHIENRIEMMETIARSLEKQVLGDAIVTGVEFDPVYDANLLRSTHVFVSVCVVSVRVLK